MALTRHVTFGDFRLDPTNECLWQGGQAITLRPKAYRVLQHLVDRPGQLVTKQQLMEAVWPGTFVGDAVLKVTVRQLREALNDDADRPRYIETSHRRGYRFIGPILEEAVRTVAPPRVADASPLRAGPPSAPGVLGREAEFAKMRGWRDRAWRGERQVVFVTGEAGIGKTTLVNVLREATNAVRGSDRSAGSVSSSMAPARRTCRCSTAISGWPRAGRRQGSRRCSASTRRSGCCSCRRCVPAAEPRVPAAARGLGATRERMLREMAEAIEAIASSILPNR